MIKDTLVTNNAAINRAGQRLYNFKTADTDSIALPLTTGTDTFERVGLTGGSERAYFEVCFWTDDTLTTKATPAAGTVKFRGAMTDNMIWKTMPNGSFDAAVYAVETTPIPEGRGPMRYVEVVIDGDNSPATYATVTVDKYSI